MIPVYDKYAPYIWACYGVSVLVLLALAWWSAARARRVRRELEGLDGARRRAKAASEGAQR